MVAEQGSPAESLGVERAGAVRRIAALERELLAIIESGSAGADDEHDPEGATLAFERQHVAALLSQARQHLAQIDAAVTRLAEGTFGRCVTCGKPIDAARLAARPVSSTCIRCASLRA